MLAQRLQAGHMALSSRIRAIMATAGMRLDVSQHAGCVRVTVTWTEPHSRDGSNDGTSPRSVELLTCVTCTEV
jgi:hypothetical protein